MRASVGGGGWAGGSAGRLDRQQHWACGLGGMRWCVVSQNVGGSGAGGCVRMLGIPLTYDGTNLTVVS
jgi:hypothetical protein